jgi:hypothetical protein
MKAQPLPTFSAVHDQLSFRAGQGENSAAGAESLIAVEFLNMLRQVDRCAQLPDASVFVRTRA